MRTLVTFLFRLWVDHNDGPPNWKGRLECVTTGDGIHVQSMEELVDFIEAHVQSESEQSITWGVDDDRP